MAFNFTKIIGDIFAKSKSEIVTYTKDNPMGGVSEDDYLFRTKTASIHYFPHLRNYYLNDGVLGYKNIFDQTIVIESTLDVDVSISLAIVDGQGVGRTLTQNEILSFNLGEIEKGNTKTKKMVLIPESSSDNYTESTGTIVHNISELRQPLTAFRIIVNSTGNATVGELKIMSIRRY